MKFIFDSGKASKSGRTNPESVAGFNRNTRQLSTGIGGRFAPDFPIRLLFANIPWVIQTSGLLNGEKF
ncbi:MAG: hypothetical protein HOE30_22755 [Deltaproteobacteria bacterium]|nr:hypothetical protein [Deltaproteobacteria bacterium]